jgi:hypothetical protein
MGVDCSHRYRRRHRRRESRSYLVHQPIATGLHLGQPSRCYFPLLMTKLTLVPPGSDFRALGLCEMISPFGTFLEVAFLILPTAQ